MIKRPSHFCFRPGDYVFVNIPAIALYEWHPFTLSSAPEEVLPTLLIYIECDDALLGPVHLFLG